jgi:N-acetylmuramoyl-L-alanine amidase
MVPHQQELLAPAKFRSILADVNRAQGTCADGEAGRISMAEMRVTWRDLKQGILLATGTTHTLILAGASLNLALTDAQGAPVTGAAYRITQANAPAVDGTLNDEGTAKVSGLLAGACEISFPDYDATDWLPAAELPLTGQTHEVASGEHLAVIAAERGFHNFLAIWDHPNNAALKERRENPHVLQPGDLLFVPDRSQGGASGQTGSSYTFNLKCAHLLLRLKLLSLNGKPLVGEGCTLTLDGADTQVETDVDGLVELVIPPATRSATLVAGEQRYDLVVGGLDPVDSPTGLQARLYNLGYDVGVEVETGKVDVDELRFAIQLFQSEHDLPVTGEADDKTRLAIGQLAGC